MKELQPPDIFHLQAAEGWLELGNPSEANEEVKKISASHRDHPSVLRLRWGVSAAAKDWAVCVDLAKAWTSLAPEQEEGWTNLGNCLYFCGRTQEAYETVKRVLGDFPQSPVLRYNLACYACQLGKLQEARSWLEEAFASDPTKRLKEAAHGDPDLKPLWKSINQG